MGNHSDFLVTATLFFFPFAPVVDISGYWVDVLFLVQYRLYAQSKTRYANEQFIEMFDVDLVSLPSTAAPWLVETMALMVSG